MTPESEIRNIQRSYLEVLDSHFSGLWRKYKDSNLSPIEFLQETETLSSLLVFHSGRRWTSLSYRADQLLDDVSSFWATNRQPLQNALKHSDKLNTQVGDLNGMSSYYLSATLRLGLYFDSICLLDPLSIMAQRRETIDHYLTGKNDDPQLTQLLLSYLEMRSLKPLLTSETDSPIAIFVPPSGLVWGDSAFKYIEQVSLSNTFSLFADAFDEQIESWEDIFRLSSQYSIQDLEVILRNHRGLSSLFYEIGFKSLPELVKFSTVSTQLPDSIDFSGIPHELKAFAHIFGTVQGALLALEGSEVSAAEMHIDVNIPRSLWTLNKFRTKHAAELLSKYGLRDEIPIQAAIMSEEMDWMAATTVEDLVQMREKGLMERVREIYRINRRELQCASLENFESAATAVVERVTGALQECMNEIEDLKRSSLRKWITRIGQFTLSGGLGIASVFFPPIGLLDLGFSIAAPGASITDLIIEYRDNEKRWQELGSRPIVHMLEIWKRRSNLTNDNAL